MKKGSVALVLTTPVSMDKRSSTLLSYTPPEFAVCGVRLTPTLAQPPSPSSGL